MVYDELSTFTNYIYQNKISIEVSLKHVTYYAWIEWFALPNAGGSPDHAHNYLADPVKGVRPYLLLNLCQGK